MDIGMRKKQLNTSPTGCKQHITKYARNFSSRLKSSDTVFTKNCHKSPISAKTCLGCDKNLLSKTFLKSVNFCVGVLSLELKQSINEDNMLRRFSFFSL